MSTPERCLFVTKPWSDSQKSEDNLGMAESELDKQTNLITELTKKVDDLQEKADQAAKLKDQVDE